MQDEQLLDYLAALFRAAEHPEIKDVERFEGKDAHGVRLHFHGGAIGYPTIIRPHARKAAAR